MKKLEVLVLTGLTGQEGKLEKILAQTPALPKERIIRGREFGVGKAGEKQPQVCDDSWKL